jgi:hypothetical protein
MSLIFEIPSVFANPALYERVGAIIKDRATGHIVGHVQELSGWGLIKSLPIPGANLLQLGLDAVQAVQLHRIKQTLDAVQSLATVGAVASVATLGVCVGGFTAVLGKLRRMDGKLDQALSQVSAIRGLVQDMDVKLDALPLARLKSRLEVIDLARHFDPVRRRTSLERAVDDLGELRHFYATLLASPRFCSLSSSQLVALLDTQERFMVTCEAELFAEFLLSGDPELIGHRLHKQQQQLDSFAWSSAKELYLLAEEGDRMSGRYLVTSPEVRKAQVKDVAAVRAESTDRLVSWPHLARHLRSTGTEPQQYIKAVEDLNASALHPVMVLDCRPSRTSTNH